jgi:hypothetical protein
MRTNQLVAQLAGEATPVRVLARPWTRAVFWTAVGSVYLTVLVVAVSLRDDFGVRVRDPWFVTEQLAALATGVTAAAAAFASVVPGYRRDIVLLPLASLAAWLAIVTVQALPEFQTGGAAMVGADWRCVAAILVGSAVPAGTMFTMIRRGAPLSPRPTAGLGALAAAGLGNLGICLFHPHNSSAIILFWHCGAVLALSAAAMFVGARFLRWPVARSLTAVS